MLETADKTLGNEFPGHSHKQSLSFGYEVTGHANLFHGRTSHMGLQQEHSKAVTVTHLGSSTNLKSEVEHTHVPDNEDNMSGISQTIN
jgi:hypothetical protein